MENRKYYIDFLRILAVLFVVMNHTDSLFHMFNKVNIITWGISAVLFFVAKAAVPLFIMITGALTLGRDQSYKKLFLKFGKTILLLIIWSAIYFIYDTHSMITLKKIIPFISTIIRKPISTHFWYLYMLIGLYIMMPFIQKMVKDFNKIDYGIYLTIWLLFTSVLPFLKVFKNINITSYFGISLFLGYSGFLVLGYFIANLTITKKIVYFAWLSLIASVIVMYAVTYHFSSLEQKTSTVLDNASMFPVVIISASIFIMLKYYITTQKNVLNNPKFSRILLDISKKTFGIYLIHILIMAIFINGVIYTFISNHSFNPIITLFIWDGFIIIISYLVISVIGKIPYLNKIVYF